MKSRWFLRVWMFGFVCIAASCLICSLAFGQFSQDVSVSWGNLFSNYSLDSSLYLSPLLQSSSYSSTLTNPFATVSNEYSSYKDILSTSFNQSTSYQNIFGFGYSGGSSLYSDPFYTSAGGYSTIMAPGSSYSSEYNTSQSLLGGSSHYENSLILPWTTYSSDITSSYGIDAWPYGTTFSGSSVAVGTPTVFSGFLTGFDRASEGVANLVAYAPISAQMDLALGAKPMYTAEGMPFYATASYFNPYNASNYYFAPGVKTSSVGTIPGGIVGSSSVVTGAGYVAGTTIGGGIVGGGLGGGIVGGGGLVGGGVGLGSVGGTGSPAAGGFSAAGFSAVVSPVP